MGLLSGGQRQALTLLMATLVTPKLLLLDEHTAALDPATAEKVLALTKKIVAENHITCLMITHNIPSALSLGNRTIMMNNGRIVLELAGAERENMTTEQLLKVFHEQGVSNDRILFSAGIMNTNGVTRKGHAVRYGNTAKLKNCLQPRPFSLE